MPFGQVIRPCSFASLIFSIVFAAVNQNSIIYGPYRNEVQISIFDTEQTPLGEQKRGLQFFCHDRGRIRWVLIARGKGKTMFIAK